jgi:hypothetical protein
LSDAQSWPELTMESGERCLGAGELLHSQRWWG